MKGLLTLIRINTRLVLRSRTVLFFNYVFPFIFFFIFQSVMGRGSSSSAAYILAMVLVLGIIGNGLFGVGVRAVEERERGVLRRYKLAPITPAPILISSLVVGYIFYFPLVLILLALSRWLYHMEMPRHIGAFFLIITLGLLAFRAIGLVIASVSTSLQESQVIVQLLYFPMLFLSGATFPMNMLPAWVQKISQFIPATYLINGFQGVMIKGEGLSHNLLNLAALATTCALGLFIGVKLFRWEKEERIATRAKLWVLGVLLPFFILGVWENVTGGNIKEAREIWRQMQRSNLLAIRGGRIMVGDGRIVENGVLIIKDGKIAALLREGEGTVPSISQTINARGKTVLPGLCDAHVHLALTGTYGAGPTEAGDPSKSGERELARHLRAHLYCGVTAVRSAGDRLEQARALQEKIRSGELVGPELLIVGPSLVPSGLRETDWFKQLPESLRTVFPQVTRELVDAAQARAEVRKLIENVDGIKIVLNMGMANRRLSREILEAAIAEAHTRSNIRVVVHTEDARDVAEAVSAGADGIEHGSFRDPIPDTLFATMAEKEVFYDPTLAAMDSFLHLSDPRFTERPLIEQTVPFEIINGLKNWVRKEKSTLAAMEQVMSKGLEIGRENLRRAYQMSVLLSLGTDAGNLGVFHGPAIHRELRLWVEAGVPAHAALQAATFNNALLLKTRDELGYIEPGRPANLLVVNGNPLADISATENISDVIYKGERIDREKLLKD